MAPFPVTKTVANTAENAAKTPSTKAPTKAAAAKPVTAKASTSKTTGGADTRPRSFAESCLIRGALFLVCVITLGVVVQRVLNRPKPRLTSQASAGFADVHPSLLVTNPRVLLDLEASGLSFGDLFGVRKANEPRYQDYSEESAELLETSPMYADLVRVLASDLAALQAATPDSGIGARFAHRLFDSRWLTSERVHFELVGVVNRLDFRMLAPPGCGQTRLVYRMALRPAGRPQTRLPMTINVIFENRQEQCADLARSWLALDDGVDLANRLRRGPLALTPTRFDRIEVDLQSLRQNSSGPHMDDHAEYILRGFDVVAGHLVESTLRNTPDPASSPEKTEALRGWIETHLPQIDDGSAEIPAELLATRAVSVTPRGLARQLNRPFKALFPDEHAAFDSMSFTGATLATSPAMLVRRLDEMTCVGCHQARSVAGFHLLGEDRGDGSFNAMTLGISEHLREILEFRHRFIEDVAAGRKPREPMPIAEHVDARGDYGAHCTDYDGATSGELPDWQCAPSFVCERSVVDDDPIGLCVPAGAKGTGDPCQDVALHAKVRPDGDDVVPHDLATCARKSTSAPASETARCEPNQHGFPGGMCSVVCDHEGQRTDDGVCVRIPRFGSERACFSNDTVIEKCFADPRYTAVQRMRTCTRTDPCRDDFVCARLAGEPLDHGVCMPPYFIFQARVDGPSKDR